MAALEPAATDPAAVRAELERVLGSPEFAASRQLQDFLRHISERALEGATHLDQAGIAAAVLGQSDFDPIADATVRKLASMVRQRLEQHYRRSGEPSGVVIALPLRSYVPRFEHLVPPGAAPPLPAPVSPLRWWRRGWVWALVAGVALVAAGVALLPAWRVDTAPDGTLTIETAHGDLTGPGADVDRAAVRLGPPLRPVDEVSVRLHFAARQEAQQAGVAVWQDADNYIRLGPWFYGRNRLDSRAEVNGRDLPDTGGYDPEGQSGVPLWLAIRRNRDVYRRFLSRDGIHWEPAGPALTLPLRAPRAAVYAMNGRRTAPSALARFQHFSTGLTFHALGFSFAAPPEGAGQLGSAGQLDATALPGSTAPPGRAAQPDATAPPEGAGQPQASNVAVPDWSDSGWTESGNCGGRLERFLEPSALRIDAAGGGRPCNWELTRPVNGTEWRISARLDFQPAVGVSAGLAVRGANGSVRVVRYMLNGPSISLIHDRKEVVGEPDLNGSPAVILRLEASGGWLSGSYSADGENFHRLATRVRLADLGGQLRAGIRWTQATADADRVPHRARFYWLRETVPGPQPWR